MKPESINFEIKSDVVEALNELEKAKLKVELQRKEKKWWQFWK